MILAFLFHSCQIRFTLLQRKIINSSIMLAPIIYIAAVLIANYTATWFIPLPIFGQVAVGTFVFGITFTQRDIMHQEGNRKLVYKAILIAALLSSIMSVVLAVPFRIILASFTAIILAEAADTEIYQKIWHQSWIIKVISSNAVSIPLDSLLFNLIAFAGEFSTLELTGIIWGEIVVKTLTGLLAGLIAAKRYSQPTSH